MQKPDRIEIIAHRAGNSETAFLSAVKSGADIMETDVHLTRDGKLVAQYAPFIEKNGKKLYFSDCDFCEFAETDIFPLERVFALAKQHGVKLLLDVKKGKDFYTHIGAKIAGLAEKLNMTDRAEVLAFDHKCVEEVKKLSHIRGGIMYVARLSCLDAVLKACKPDFIEICGDYLDEEAVETAKANNVQVYGWGTDDAATLMRYKDLGMKAVTVNDVDSAVKLLK